MKHGKAIVFGLMLATVGIAVAGTEDDARRTLKVKLALLDHLGADGLDIGVVATGGDVQLEGTVPSRDAQDLAWTIARSVAGVDGVRNGVRVVDRAAAAAAAGAPNSRADAEVADAMLGYQVRISLIDKLGSEGMDISTRATNGNVSLAFRPGLASARRQDALETVKSVDGVASVTSMGEK